MMSRSASSGNRETEADRGGWRRTGGSCDQIRIEKTGQENE
jgi:hypothetical protein